MKRSAVSIPSNIAEGYRRNNVKEFIHFLRIAAGSAAELETQLLITTDVYSIETTTAQNDLLVVQKQLTALSRSLRQKL